MRRFLSLLLVLIALPAWAAEETIVAGMSQNRVSITANFDGSEILIFGAVKREAPAPDGALHVAVIVEGPPEHLTVRRKDKRAGIWVNTDVVEITSAPTFYAIATSGPFDEVIGAELDASRHVSITEAIKGLESDGAQDVEAFADAVIRIREKAGLYALNEGAVTVTDGTLFETRIQLPANLTEGFYKARILLTRDGEAVANHFTNVHVQKVGIERFLYRLAHDMPFVYGLMSLAIAVVAGWGASAAFRMLLRS